MTAVLVGTEERQIQHGHKSTKEEIKVREVHVIM